MFDLKKSWQKKSDEEGQEEKKKPARSRKIKKQVSEKSTKGEGGLCCLPVGKGDILFFRAGKIKRG